MTPSDRLRMAHVAVEGAARNLYNAAAGIPGQEAWRVPARYMDELRSALHVLADAQKATGEPLWSALPKVPPAQVVNPHPMEGACVCGTMPTKPRRLCPTCRLTDAHGQLGAGKVRR